MFYIEIMSLKEIVYETDEFLTKREMRRPDAV